MPDVLFALSDTALIAIIAIVSVAVVTIIWISKNGKSSKINVENRNEQTWTSGDRCDSNGASKRGELSPRKKPRS